MTTRHNHCAGCEHNNMKYCKHCKTPYCNDCGQEWRTNNYWQSYPYITYTLNGLTQYSKDALQGSTAGQSPDVVKMSETVCSGGHKG